MVGPPFHPDPKANVEAGLLPSYEAVHADLDRRPARRAASRPSRAVLLRASFVALLALVSLVSLVSHHSASSFHSVYRPTSNPRLQQVFAKSLQRCKEIKTPAGPPAGFRNRTISDRYEQGTRDLLVRNATIWTGEENGSQVLEGYDVHVSKGLIRGIFKTGSRPHLADDVGRVHVVDAAGRWLTPGLVDMHVHLSAQPSPALSGADDVNSIGSNVNPWLRVADGLNQHDPSFKLSLSGGITSGLVLPGSANSMGGQAYPLKYRQVSSHIPSDRLIDPPRALTRLGQGKTGSASDLDADHYGTLTGMARNDSSSSWRHMKMACGENPRRIYSKTRMDEAWDFRQLFDEARTLKNQQDGFCAQAESFAALHGEGVAPLAESEATFPESLRLEALVDLFRGKVKLNTHCYTQIDFESFIRHTNEFEFQVGAFHHAHEAYLVPELLRKAYGDATPAIAIFSTNANYKLEAYFGSPFAGAILDSYNITPIYKSDHPVTDSRRILNQAAQAHHFGLSAEAALRAVTTAPAERLGLDHRIGFVRQGWDADLVLWNNHPLSIGATPVEVVIDGILQLGAAAHVPAPFLPGDDNVERFAPPPPRSGRYADAIETVKKSGDEIILYEKLAFPTAQKAIPGCVAFTNVSKVYSKAEEGSDGAATAAAAGRVYRRGKIYAIQSEVLAAESSAVVVLDGKVICQGGADCLSQCASGSHLDLHGGVLTPGLTSYGSDLGLTDIVSESEASDGGTLDPLTSSDNQAAQTAVSLRSWPLARATDGLQWSGHDLLRARASGVTDAVVLPQSNTFFSGISVRFDTGATTLLDRGAVVQEEVGVHVTLNHNRGAPSISEQIGWLRHLLSSDPDEPRSQNQETWHRVATGQLPLIVTALRADHITHLLKLSDAYPHLRLTISGATESHLVAPELASRNVTVLLIPQTWARTWDERRALPGPPLSATTTLSALLRAGVKVALKVEEAWQASNLLWDAVRAALETDGLLSREDVLGLVSGGVEEVLGMERRGTGVVAWDGEPFQYGVKAVAVAGVRGLERIEQV